jgi:hypothetical protein
MFGLRHGTMVPMDRELRDWLRELAKSHAQETLEPPAELSEEGSEYLGRVATDGTLKAALAELAASEPELAG